MNFSPNVTEFTEPERNAMRAYLQRCEVRLSTLHRIATAFIGGAGLMLLMPVFFKDVIDKLIEVILRQAGNQFPTLDPTLGWALTVVFLAMLAMPLIASLLIPLYGVYMLLLDVVHFYFTIYAPGFADSLLNPTFALTGLLFPKDESPRVKQEVMRYEYGYAHSGFLIPFSEDRMERYFDTLIETTKGEIIPQTRHFDTLQAQGVLPMDTTSKADVDRFNAALGIARSLDRTLIEEVAVTEMSVARHVLYLRRLLLRYVKTLMMFIWTSVASFLVLPFLSDARFPALLMLSLAYLVWSLGAQRAMRLPVIWIYRHRGGQPQHVDGQLRMMDRVVMPALRAATLCASGASILAIASLWLK